MCKTKNKLRNESTQTSLTTAATQLHLTELIERQVVWVVATLQALVVAVHQTKRSKQYCRNDTTTKSNKNRSYIDRTPVR